MPTAHLLSLLGRTDVALAAGAEAPLLGSRRAAQSRELACPAGRLRAAHPRVEGPFPEPRAVSLIQRVARECDGLAVVAIGPLTNLAAALLADPGLAGRLARVVVMGGAFEVPGNVTPTAEFNFFMDPEAAQVVLDAGVRPWLLTLEPALVQIETEGASVAWLPGRESAWSRPEGPDNALVATAVDVEAFAALVAERVLARL